MGTKKRVGALRALWGWGSSIAAALSLLMACSAFYELFIPVTGVHYPRIHRAVDGGLVFRFDTPMVGWSVVLVASLACVACCIALLSGLHRSRQSPPGRVRLAVLPFLAVQGVAYVVVVADAFSSMGGFE